MIACLAGGAEGACRGQEVPGGLGLLTAVELALANDPDIASVRSQVKAARGNLLAALSRFDPVLGAEVARSEVARGGAAADEVTFVTSWGLAQELTTGLSLEPAIVLARTDEDGPGENQATVAFTLRQPLLRGRGRRAVTAVARAAEDDLAASRLDLHHAVSARLAAVASRYWAVVAAALDLEVLRTTEDSSRALLATTRRLVEADVTPAADSVQIEADVVAREASRIAGEQALFAARQALGQEIGLEAREIAALPFPSDAFPTVDPEAVPARDRSLAFVRVALARRADLQAARERVEASRALLDGARNELRPRLDLLLTPSYSGRVTGNDAGDFVSPLFEDVPGLSTVVAVSLSWPVRNRLAEGVLLQTEAAVELAALRVERIATDVGAEVPAALDAVHKAALQVDRSAEAIRLFEQAVENEEKKLQAASSTLIDLLNQRDRLTAARQRWVRARLDLARAIVDLRFQTGTLLADADDAGSLDYEDLTTLPELGPP